MTQLKEGGEARKDVEVQRNGEIEDRQELINYFGLSEHKYLFVRVMDLINGGENKHHT